MDHAAAQIMGASREHHATVKLTMLFNLLFTWFSVPSRYIKKTLAAFLIFPITFLPSIAQSSVGQPSRESYPIRPKKAMYGSVRLKNRADTQ